jgi:Pyridoxamine 5'-phosphate oxidase
MSENSRLAQAILSQPASITLSTATKDGYPRLAPVYAAFDAHIHLLLGRGFLRSSFPRTIDANHRIAIVVYEETVPRGTGKGVNTLGQAAGTDLFSALLGRTRSRVGEELQEAPTIDKNHLTLERSPFDEKNSRPHFPHA